MIQNAATSYEQSLSNRTESAAEALEEAEQILDVVFENYIEPEIRYGHLSVFIDDYVSKLGIQDSRVRTAFFDILKEAGYETTITNVAISNVRVASSGTLMISWNKIKNCVNGFGKKKHFECGIDAGE